MLDRLAEADYRPDPRLVRALDRMFIVHAEHASATSTAGVRHLASTGVDPYTAISGNACAQEGSAALRCVCAVRLTGTSRLRCSAGGHVRTRAQALRALSLASGVGALR